MPDPYLTAAEVKALVPRVATEDDTVIETHVAVFEELAERYLGVAFRARSETYTAVPVCGVLELPRYEVTAVASLVDENANAVTYRRLRGRQGYLEGVWSASPLTATFTHGETAPTELLKQACATYVSRSVALDNSGTSRDIKFSGDGGQSIPVRPNWSAGEPTGFTDVDWRLNAERDRRPKVF